MIKITTTSIPIPYFSITVLSPDVISTSPWAVACTIYRPYSDKATPVEVHEKGVYVEKHIPGSNIMHRQYLGSKGEDELTFQGILQLDRLKLERSRSLTAETLAKGGTGLSIGSQIISIQPTGTLPDEIGLIGAKPNSPMDVVLKFDNLIKYAVQHGNKVRITTSEHLAMIGYLKDYALSSDEPWKYKWKIVVLRGVSGYEAPSVAAIVTQKAAASSLLDNAIAAMNKAVDDMKKLRAFVKGKLAIVKSITGKIDSLVSSAFSLFNIVGATMKDIVGTYEGILVTLGNIKQGALDVAINLTSAGMAAVQAYYDSIGTVTDWSGYKAVFKGSLDSYAPAGYLSTPEGRAFLESLANMQRSAEKQSFQDTTLYIYTVKDGDTWGSIARKTTGDYNNWSCIKTFNGLKGDPKVGDRIVIPIC